MQEKSRSLSFCRALCGVSLLLLSLCVRPGTVHADVNLWPLLELSQDETTILYPFFSKDEELLMLFPIYFGLPKEGEHHLLWPLIKVEEGTVRRVLPFWVRDDPDEYLFLPFVWHRKEGTMWFLPPTWVESDGRLGAVFPFFVRSHADKPGGGSVENLHVLWPVYSREEERAADGRVAARSRRWLLFSEALNERGDRTIRLLGIPISESIRRQ